MKTLIVPCASGKKINNIPFYLNKYPTGVLLIRQILENINLENFNRIIIAILEEENYKFNAKERIEKEFINFTLVPEVIILSKPTKDATETIFCTIKKANIVGKIVIKDSNNSIFIPKISHNNFIGGINISQNDKEIQDLKKMSFLIINDKNQILDIIEKRICSENISIGLYGFEDVNDFIFAYEKLNNSNYPIKKLFISHIISYLIGCKDTIFHYLQVNNFEDLGNEQALINLQKRFTNYFIDLDSLFGKNLNFKDKKEVSQLIKSIIEKGFFITLFTSKGEEYRKNIEVFFSSNIITYNLIIICNCHKVQNNILINNKEELKF